ncbi:MAG: hypothetical protein QXX08_10775 [Candidatus Bathyarchaeia archaeon]
MEATEDWANDYAYIKAEKLSPALENGLAQVANKERKNGEITMAKLQTKFDTTDFFKLYLYKYGCMKKIRSNSPESKKQTNMKKTTIELTEEQYFFLKEKALELQKQNQNASIVSIIRDLIEKDRQDWIHRKALRAEKLR